MFTSEPISTPGSRDLERSSMVRASRLYYLEGKGQAEIARILKVSRPSVSRLLTRARLEGIVEIRVRGSEDGTDWAAVARGIGLSELVVAASESLSAEETKAAVGQAGADWFALHVQPGEAVGLTAGTTLSAFTRHVRHGLGLGLKIVPLVGTLWDTGQDFDGSFLCQELRRRVGGTHLVLSAPAVVGSTALARSLRAEPRVRGVLELFSTLEHVFLGIGNAEEDHPIVIAAKRSALGTDENRRILPRQAVASVGCLFFDSQGKPCRTALDGRTIGIRHDDLMAIPVRVGLGCGKDKLAASLALVRGGVVNVLVVDEALAHGLRRSSKDPGR